MMRKNNNPIITLLCVILFHSCTFGSIGDSNKEQLQILQNLLALRNGLTTGLTTSFQVYDNQADDLVSNIDLVSGSNTYSISVLSDSYIQWETGYYRINPPDRLFGVLDVRTHTPYTVPLDLPATDIYGRNYIFLNSQKELNFTNYNSTNETGAAYTSTSTRKILDSPLGVISLATISWEEFYLNLSITRSGTTKTAKILLGQGFVNLKPKCKLRVDSSRTKPINVGLQYSNLFRDYVENGTTVSFLQNLFLVSGSEIIITSISNTDLLANVKKNLATEDLVIGFPGCTPGLEK
jgi:hypothetical protein